MMKCQFGPFSPLDEVSCEHWASLEYWTVPQALYLALGADPTGTNTIDPTEDEDLRMGEDYLALVRMITAHINCNLFPHTKIPNQFVEDGDHDNEKYVKIVTPHEFVGWANSYKQWLPAIFPEQLRLAVLKREKTKPDEHAICQNRSQQPVTGSDMEKMLHAIGSLRLTECPVAEKVTKLRNSQRHSERCRAIAALMWNKAPETTIADMVVTEEIREFGCEGYPYNGDTLRDWVNDLCPNREPGRRKEKQ